MPDQPKDSGQPVPAPAGGEVERFEFECSFRGNAEAVDNPEGRWVRYEDYEKLKGDLDLMAKGFFIASERGGFEPRNPNRTP